MPIDVLTLSTKGQLVLPNDLRKNLSLEPGDKIIAYWSNDSIVLKKLELPSENDFEKRIEETVKYAKENGIKGLDISSTIKVYRSEKRSKWK